MNPHRNTNTEEEDGALWRRLVLSEEDRLRLFQPRTACPIEELKWVPSAEPLQVMAGPIPFRLPLSPFEPSN